MFHPASVEVTCDGDGCDVHQFIALEWRHRSMAESSGSYNPSDKAVEGALIDKHEWIVVDGKHYCSPGCAKANKEK